MAKAKILYIICVTYRRLCLVLFCKKKRRSVKRHNAV